MPPGGPGGMRGPNRFLTEEEKKNRPKITSKLLKRIFSYLLPYWPKLLLVLAAIVLSSIFGLLPSILTGKIIDEGLIGRNFGVLVQLILLSFAVLTDLNFCVKAGRSVAIVGPSGAGKSTIINLIPRLYDVTEGKITLDGQDIRNIDLETLRKNIGVVTQDTYLFNGTIRENLLYANANATEEQMMEACRRANIHDFIASLPKGYDTLVGNRGIKLSGGEKQRVSIARVILKDPRLLILDEATSALDSISESLIQDAINPLLQGRTSLVIAHRLSTIMAADEILVVERGRIVQRGTHRELVGQDGVYRELYETQFRRALADQEERRENPTKPVFVH